MAVPWPPVLISSGTSTLLSQTFISDYPASALVLINPPGGAEETKLLNQGTTTTSDSKTDSASAPVSSQQDQSTGGGFTYEPHFPILVLSTPNKRTSIFGGNEPVETHRLVKGWAGQAIGRGGKGVTYEKLEGSDERSDKTRIEVERWLDRCGF